MSPKSEWVWLAKAVLTMAKGETKDPLAYLETAMSSPSTCIPATLALACITFRDGNYQKALEYYSNVLRKHPRCPARVRLGMGLCFYRLKHFDRARAAFERTLELDPNCVEALVGLSLLHINNTEHSVPIRIREAVTLLGRAFTIDSNNAMVLNHLCNYFFFKDDFEKVQKLAPAAQRNTESKQIKAEALFNIARTYHAQEEYDQAGRSYQHSLQSSESFALAHFGLGQIRIAQNEITGAIASFEKVDELVPENFETSKILGALYAAERRYEKAREKLTSVTELWPADDDCWIELAQVLERFDVQASLKAYEKALKLKLQMMDEKDIPMELWNNLGALRQRTGDLQGARKAYDLALLTGQGSSKAITTTYNLARLHEQMHNYLEAERLYKDILRQHPNYVDCTLRLGVMARDRGNSHEAVEHFTAAVSSNSSNLDSWTLWGNLHLDRGEWGDAERKFKRIVRDISKDDSYANLSLARILYQTAKPAASDVLLEALPRAQQILRKDPKNVYAANMCGAIMCELGYVSTAKEAFTQVREAANNDMADVMINLAHVELHYREFEKAISLYSSCLKKFFNYTNTNLLQLIAYAHFEQEKMQEAVKIMQQALHLDPADPMIIYNLAVAEYHLASKLKSQSQLAIVQQACRARLHAERAFQYLASTHVSDSSIPRKNLVTYLEKCEKLNIDLEKKVSVAQKREEALQQERMRKERETEGQRLALLKQEEEKKRQEARQKEMEVRLLEEQARRTQELVSKWGSEKQEESIKKVKRKHSTHEGDAVKDESTPLSALPRHHSDSDPDNSHDDEPRNKRIRRLQRQHSSSDDDDAPFDNNDTLRKAGLESDDDSDTNMDSGINQQSQIQTPPHPGNNTDSDD
eukprot:c9659_g1_i1.p1 GENE.c9659_g1_i1~~c9659_g1_i1.p1  ORF type:complete len:1008 (+),score=284.05 c9659_g1_i1:410-3025(+)